MQGDEVLRTKHPGLVVNPFPFEEVRTGRLATRRFSGAGDAGELTWHRDAEDRIVTVVEGTGWHFQRDDELPVELHPGDVFHIASCSWHRLARAGVGDLVVVVEKLPADPGADDEAIGD